MKKIIRETFLSTKMIVKPAGEYNPIVAFDVKKFLENRTYFKANFINLICVPLLYENHSLYYMTVVMRGTSNKNLAELDIGMSINSATIKLSIQSGYSAVCPHFSEKIAEMTKLFSSSSSVSLFDAIEYIRKRFSENRKEHDLDLYIKDKHFTYERKENEI